MAKIVTQSIPSENRLWYKRAMQIATTRKGSQYVRLRYPWRVPKMQAGGSGVSPAQVANRAKFNLVKERYALLDATAKARWAAANPEYHSYLFGYNFFMLEGFLGGGPIQYPDVIKSIQIVKAEVPTTGTKSFAISAVDPDKCVVLIQGNSYISDTVQRGTGTVSSGSSVNCALSPNIDPAISEVRLQGEIGIMELSEGSGEGTWRTPYVTALIAAQLTVALQTVEAGSTCSFSYEVIEHKAQTVYPVLVSIAAEAVVIDWALVPSVAADVSITVVEYL